MREGAGRPGAAGTQGRVDPAGKREMVRKEGLEPSRPYGHKLLRLTRLPIPPLPHSESPYYSHFPATRKYRRWPAWLPVKPFKNLTFVGIILPFKNLTLLAALGGRFFRA